MFIFIKKNNIWMIQISSFIIEKLYINKDYIISTKGWLRSTVAIVIDAIKLFKNNNRKSLSSDQLKFINKIYLDLQTYWDYNLNVENDPKLIKLLNGESPDFKNLKVIYDAVTWTLNNDKKCTIPKRKKLKKILKEIKPWEHEIEDLEY